MKDRSVEMYDSFVLKYVSRHTATRTHYTFNDNAFNGRHVGTSTIYNIRRIVVA